MIYSSINSRATLIDSVAYLLTYGKTFKNTACACYSNSAINWINTEISNLVSGNLHVATWLKQSMWQIVLNRNDRNWEKFQFPKVIWTSFISFANSKAILNHIFSWEPALWTLNSQGRVMLSKNIDMKTKVVQHVPRIIFNVFKVFKFSKFSGSQCLSDFQTFIYVTIHLLSPYSLHSLWF